MTNRRLAINLALGFLASTLASCAGDDGDSGNGDAGAPGTAVGGSSPAAGGDAATAGSLSTGGITGSGGAATGGAVGLGGGSEPAGGAPGSGGSASVESGGAPASGGAASGGAPSGTGGSAESGGAPNGGAPAAGGSGAGGSPASGGDGAGGASAGAAGEVGVGVGGASGAGAGGTAGASSSTCPDGSVSPLAQGAVPPGYCAWIWADGIDTPRGITVDGNGDVLVVERGGAQVLLLHDDDGSGVSESGERVNLASASGINHGVAVHGGHVYASSASAVYRWSYMAGARTPLGTAQTVVADLPAGGHSTRTLALDGPGNLYVSIGSASNVDGDSSRARVVRFSAAQVESGASFGEAELFADGLRNEVGLRFDAQGRLWGVENGVDNLDRADLGGDIHDDNPGEEVNLLADPGRFYGYPYCWSEFLLTDGVGEGPNAQWAHPDFIDDGTHDDAWCKDPTNVVPPVVSMQAHSAPLDIHFYAGSAFPAEVIGDAIVSFHGSWNRSPATGYKVVRLPFDDSGLPTGEVLPLLEYSGTGDTANDWPHRPVGIAELPNGVLLVTSDASDVIIAVGYDG